MTPRQARALLGRFAAARLLVVGDLMLDHFIWGRVERVSPEAPVPVVDVTEETFHLGGAANVAHNIAALGGQAAIAGVVGGDFAGRVVLQQLDAQRIGPAGVVLSRSAVTARKARVIAHNQQVVRFDHEQRDHAATVTARIARYVREHAASFDAVVVSDYGKGVVNEETLEALGVARRECGLTVVIDPKRRNFDRYRGMALATPNAAEAGEASGVDIRAGEAGLREAGLRLVERWQAEAILITRGEQGMTLVERDGALRHFPAKSRQVFDVTGAGDTVVATCTLALAAGASPAAAADLANQAAAIVVGKLGTATVTPEELSLAYQGSRSHAGSVPRKYA